MSTMLFRLIAEASLRSTILALLVGAALAGLRVGSSAVRHSAWTAVLCTMLCLPCLTSFVPSISVTVPLSVHSSQPAVDDIGAAATSEAARGARIAATPTTPPGNLNHASLRFTPAPFSQPSTDTFISRQTMRGIAADAALVLYVAGALLFLSRCWIGWRRTTRLVRDARLVEIPAAACVDACPPALTIRESGRLAVPVTAGVVTPVILLPAAWRTWPAVQLRAVIAHEAAHIARCDPLVSLLAHINRSVFWFHPLAWWLARALTAHAEHACDAAAIRALGNQRAYADVLIEMSRAAYAAGGRVMPGLEGINGGLARDRIERISDTAWGSELSAARKLLVAAGCAAAIIAAVACRPAAGIGDADSMFEQRDYKLRQDVRRIERQPPPSDGELDPSQVEALEADVNRNAADLASLERLLTHYWIHPVREARRAHILRLIERHPDAALAGSLLARLFRTDVYRYLPDDPPRHERTGPVSLPADPEGYEQGKQRWLEYANRPDVSAIVLGNAASYFESNENPLAESLLRRARALDPQGPWAARLGRFYATVLTGSHVWTPPLMRAVAVAEPDNGYGLTIRRQLAESSDDVLLTAAGWFLARAPRERWLGFDPLGWAEACFKRALLVNPHAVLAHTELLHVRLELNGRGQALWSAPPKSQYQAVAGLPEAERFERLPRLAQAAIRALEDLDRWDDPNLRDRRELAREQARRYAADALDLASRNHAHPKYGAALYFARMTLGTLALRDGNRKEAVRFLRQAAEAPVCEDLAYGDHLVSDIHWHLAADLLRAGERDAVAAFLDRMSVVNLARRTDLRMAAAAIRRGDTPKL